MKILVLSDSHSYLRLMRQAVAAVKPNAIVHLGDFYGDGEVIHEENSQIAFYQVPGNCDRDPSSTMNPTVLCCGVCGVRLYMTHGHLHNVKMGQYGLIRDAREENAQCVLYGHTHEADCRQVDGLWVLNPGDCRSDSGSVGLLEVNNGEILSCRILRQADLEDML